MSTPSANDLYREAQKLIRAGQPVFPCRSAYQDAKHKDKAPLVHKGLHAASTDKAQIKAWWRQHRSAAIGMPTGIIWDVLDVDMKRGTDGRVHLPRLTELGLLNGCQRVVRTPSGGWHLYFHAVKGLTNKANATLGLDARAAGGYVLAPGSYIDARRNPDGGYAGYYEDHGPTSDATDDPLWWDLIVSALIPVDEDTKDEVLMLPSERRSSLASLREWLSLRQAGERNNALHWAVCRCIESNLDPNELIEPALLIGLDEAEIRLTIDAALRRAGLTAGELDTEMEAMFPDDE